jgi:hypothetical protein
MPTLLPPLSLLRRLESLVVEIGNHHRGGFQVDSGVFAQRLRSMNTCHVLVMQMTRQNPNAITSFPTLTLITWGNIYFGKC